MIRSSEQVDDKALLVASNKLNMMLANMPEARHNLAQWGAELHILSKDQQTSDLPEYRTQKGVKFVDNGIATDIDARTRGMGGIYASCGEENLLNLPGDRYAGGSDICMHEFAHDIMYYGLDDSLQAKIKRQYQNAKNKGLWKDAYAISNETEYWAELSTWYFGAHGEFLKHTKLPEPGASGLKDYDPDGYGLLDSIYSGKLKNDALDVLPCKQVGPDAKSGKQKLEGYIMFSNNTAEWRNLFWIDSDGKVIAYGGIAPYTKFMQKTFVSHIWKIADDAGKTIGFYMPITRYASAVLN